MFALRTVVALFAAGMLASAAPAADLKFEIYKDAKDEFRWRLKDGDTVLGTGGQGYAKKADCKNGVVRMQKDAADESKVTFEVYEDNAKKFRWRHRHSRLCRQCEPLPPRTSALSLFAPAGSLFPVSRDPSHAPPFVAAPGSGGRVDPRRPRRREGPPHLLRQHGPPARR